MNELLPGTQVTPDLTQGLDLDIVAKRQMRDTSRAPLVVSLLSGLALLTSGCTINNYYPDHSRVTETPQARLVDSSELRQREVKELRDFLQTYLKEDLLHYFTPDNSKFSPEYDDLPPSPYKMERGDWEVNYYRMRGWNLKGNILAKPEERITLKARVDYGNDGGISKIRVEAELGKTFGKGITPNSDWLIDTSHRRFQVAKKDVPSLAASVFNMPEDLNWNLGSDSIDQTSYGSTTFKSKKDTTVKVKSFYTFVTFEENRP